MKTPIVDEYCETCQDARYHYFSIVKGIARMKCSLCWTIKKYLPFVGVMS